MSLVRNVETGDTQRIKSSDAYALFFPQSSTGAAVRFLDGTAPSPRRRTTETCRPDIKACPDDSVWV